LDKSGALPQCRRMEISAAWIAREEEVVASREGISNLKAIE